MASCHTPASEGLFISTGNDRVRRARRGILELLLSNYPQDKIEPEAGENPTVLQKLLRDYGLSNSRYPPAREPGKVAAAHPYLRFDPAECIHCYRCIRACDEVQGQFVLAMANRGIKSHIIQGLAGDFGEAGCVSCGHRTAAGDPAGRRDRVQYHAAHGLPAGSL